MSDTPKTFADRFISGDITNIDDIDDFVGEWHAGAGSGLSLSDYLGLTPDEYKDWVIDHDLLWQRLNARKTEAKADE